MNIIDSMLNQHAKWLKVTPDPLATPDRLAQLSLDVTRVAPGPQRLQPSGPGLHRPCGQQEGQRHARLPAARREQPALGRRPLPAEPGLRQRHRRRQAARAAVARHGRGREAIAPRDRLWDWACNDGDDEPDIVMACAGDVPTLETLAAGRPPAASRAGAAQGAAGQRRGSLDASDPPTEHPHGLDDREFDALFTADRPIIFAYHGYPWLIHRLTYRRTNHDNLHVRGYKEEGTTTTPSTWPYSTTWTGSIWRSTSSNGFRISPSGTHTSSTRSATR